MVEQLNPRIEVIVPTIPGHGVEPSLSSLGIQNIGDISAYLIESLKVRDIASYYLGGYSLGGRVAINWFHKLRETKHAPRGLALFSAGFIQAEDCPPRQRFDQKRAQELRRDSKAFWNEWYSQPIFGALSSEELQHRISEKKQHNSDHLAEVLERLSPGFDEPGPEKLTQIEHLLYITGANDLKYQALAEEIRSKNERCRWESIEGAAHSVPAEKPRECARILNEWIIDLERTR
jgi:2-succinyl-6-hydroxy-2,4-cyclohexadiene-1-carboxylate synthase